MDDRDGPVEKDAEAQTATIPDKEGGNSRLQRRRLRLRQGRLTKIEAPTRNAEPVATSTTPTPPPFNITEFLAVVIGLVGLAICFSFAVISLADIAQRQRLANAFYQFSERVDHAVAVADQLYSFPLLVIDIYDWDFKSPSIEESMVVTTLRDAKVLNTEERFGTLWNFFHLTDMHDPQLSDEVYVRWLRLENPHMGTSDTEVFNEYMNEALRSEETLGFSFDDPVELDNKLRNSDGDEDTNEVAAVNIYNLFGEIATSKVEIADGYVQIGRFIDAQQVIARLTNWVRAYNVSYESDYENRANELFVLELLMEDTNAVLTNQTAFTELYGYVRGLDWDQDGVGPWWSDGDPIDRLPETQKRYAPFRCQLQYLNLMRATRLKQFSEAHERADALRSDTTCMKLSLLKEWTEIGSYQALVADLLSRSCVVRATGNEVCDINTSNDLAEYEALRQRTQSYGASFDLRRNINLNDDLLIMRSAVKEARWNGEVGDGTESPETFRQTQDSDESGEPVDLTPDAEANL